MAYFVVFRARREKYASIRGVELANRNKRPFLLLASLLGGLTGCGRPVPGVDIDKDARNYKYMHPVDVQAMQNASPGVGSAIDVTTGRPFAPPAPAPAMKLPTPVAVSSDMVLDDPNGTSDSGEKAGSWVGTLDIYWKLNWIRQELLRGNVPRLLPDVVARQKRHLARILRESKHLDPDPGHYIPEGVTIPDALTYADTALKQLEVGLEHLQQKNQMEAAGVRTLGVAWNGSEAEVARQFELQGLTKTEHATGTTAHDEEDGASPATRHPRAPRTLPATRQDEAVALALKYVRTYHASPEDMARREFEGALRDIIRMRDLLHYEFHKPSVLGSLAMVPSLLHQEASSLPPTGAPPPFKDTTDPFHKPGDAPQGVIDPSTLVKNPLQYADNRRRANAKNYIRHKSACCGTISCNSLNYIATTCAECDADRNFHVKAMSTKRQALSIKELRFLLLS